MTRSLFGEPKIADCFSVHETIILHHGDVTEFLKTLPTNLVSLVVTSPPYNLGKEYETKRALEIYLQEQASVKLTGLTLLQSNGGHG